MAPPYQSVSNEQILRLRAARRAAKTKLDYFAALLNPLLIMVLIGSLIFYLIQIFYREEAGDSLRWVMFWFVIAIVLVSRIGIEQSSGFACLYGAVLAVVTWMYMGMHHETIYLETALLAIVWWSAHRLVTDGTLFDDEPKPPPPSWRRPSKPLKQSLRLPHAPSRWVLYFSLAAVPLFGLGQLVKRLPGSPNPDSGFGLLIVYLSAAGGLLLSTSFLNMRRFLRLKKLRMPGGVASHWLLSGCWITVAVLLLAWAVPRPGAVTAWHYLGRQADQMLGKASDSALSSQPSGTDSGRDGEASDGQAEADRETQTGDTRSNAPAGTASQTANSGQEGGEVAGSPASNGGNRKAPSPAWLKNFLTVIVLVALATIIFRNRRALKELLGALGETLSAWFRRPPAPQPKPTLTIDPVRQSPFVNCRHDPFTTGQAENWSYETLLTFSYEALQTWAVDMGHPKAPELTPLERCRLLAQLYPELSSCLLPLGEQYSLLAYGSRSPQVRNTLFLRKLWQVMAS